MGMNFFAASKTNTGILPRYGRYRIENYAQSFRDLAFNMKKFSDVGMEEGENRRAYLSRKKEAQSWQLLGERFFDAAQMLEEIARECYDYVKLPTPVAMTIVHSLKKQGIWLKEIYMINSQCKGKTFCLVMKTMEKNLVATEDVAELLSKVYRKTILPAKNCSLFVGGEYTEYIFEEQGKYHVVTGQARAIKEGETVSGDNYSFVYDDKGKMYALLSDGAGSGEVAGKASGSIIDLAEKYLESGFGNLQTMSVLEGILLGNSMEDCIPTFDMCEIDLYTGDIELYKMGSAPSFLKYDRTMECIPSENLLLGYEKLGNVKIVKRQMQEENYLIMMTDGVADRIAPHMKDRVFEEMLKDKKLGNPTALAERIMTLALQAGRGRVYDDMTVLVLALYSNIGR